MEHLINSLSDDDLNRIADAAHTLPSKASLTEQLAGVMLLGVQLTLQNELDRRRKGREHAEHLASLIQADKDHGQPDQSSPTMEG